jgi:hypothetical protein
MARGCIDMSEVIIQKVATAVRCNCGHLWLTASKGKHVSCPRCHVGISKKKHAVVLESDTTRKLKEKADSELRTQNTANGNDGNYENLQR